MSHAHSKAVEGSHGRPFQGPFQGPIQDGQAQFAKVLLRGRWLVVLGALAGLSAGAAYIALTPPQFSATAGVLIEGRSNPVSASERSQSTAPLEIPEIESQVELMSSAKVVGAALASLPPEIQRGLAAGRHPLLARAKGFADRIMRSVKAMPVVGALPFIQALPPVGGRGAPALSEAEASRARVDGVRNRLSVRRVGASYAIEIAFTSPDPDVAAAVANAVAAAFVQNEISEKSDLWRRAGTWMQQRLNEVGDQAASAARKAQEFKAAHRIVDAGSRGPIDEQQMQEISTAMIDAKARVVEARSRLDEAKKVLLSGPNGNIPDGVADSVVSNLREQAAGLRQQAGQLEATLGSGHEAVVRTKANLQAVEAALMQELKRLVQSLQSNYGVALARLDSLQSSFDEVVSRSTLAGRAVVEARELDRTAETFNKLYSDLLQRYTDAVNQQSFPIAGAQIISDAAKPTAASSPRAAVALVLGSFGGVGLAVFLLFAREMSDRSLSMSQQVESLGTRCFGLLPDVDREPGFGRHASRLMSARALPRRAAADRIRAQFLVHDPASLFARSVQSVKTQIVLAGSTQVNQVVGITSARSGDGKSTVAANLANLFAVHGRRTLLIDADLFDPTISTLLDMSSRAGLAEVLRGDEEFGAAVLAAERGGLSVLPAGRAHPATVDSMFGSPEIRGLLAAARERFDHIIIDLPPVDEVVSTREIAPLLDGIVLVATWGKTRVGTLDGALQALQRDRTNVFGVVLNKATPRHVSMHGVHAAYADRLRKRVGA